MLPTVSVLIAAFNSATFIDRAIASAQAQSFPVHEILVVDDCSTDDTREVVRALGVQDARIRLLTSPRNGGPATARNLGLQAATGEWVTILDADDAFHADRTRGVLSCADRTGADVVVDSFRFWDATLGQAGKPAISFACDQQITLKEFLSKARPYAGEADWGLLKPTFRLEYLRRNHLLYPENVRHGEDFLLMLEALVRGAKVSALQIPMYFYTLRSSGMSRTPVNYRSQAKQTLQRAREPDIRSNSVLRALMKRRAGALTRLDRRGRFGFHLNQGLKHLTIATMRDPSLALVAAERALQKVSGWKTET